MTALARRVEALPSIEKARACLAQARSTHEVRHIRAIAQAVATLERGKEIGIDAAEIVLMADVRIGELTREMQKVTKSEAGRAGGKASPVSGPASKSAALAVEGISKQQASECERLAAMPKDDLNAYVKASRAAGEPPTKSVAVALAKLPSGERKKAIADIVEESVSTPIPKKERWHATDEVGRLDAFLEKMIKGWRGPNLMPLIDALEGAMERVEKEHERRKSGG